MSLSSFLANLFGSKSYVIGDPATQVARGIQQSLDKGFKSPVSMDNYISPTPQATPSPIPVMKQATKKAPTRSSSAPVNNQPINDFIANIALPITRKRQIPDSVAAAQLVAESRFGGLGMSRNNPYNIGAFDTNLGNTFRYSTPEAGVEAYAKLISEDPRYAAAYALRNNPELMLKAIQDAGYAGDQKTYRKRAKNGYNSYFDFVTNTPEWRQYFGQ